MNKDIRTKLNKQTIISKKKGQILNSKKNNESSDSDSNNSDDDELDMQEYREFLAKKFPSRHINKKVKSGKKLEQIIKNEMNDDDESDDEDYLPKIKNNQNVINKKSPKKQIKSDSEDETEDEKVEDNKKSKFNIIFTIGGSKKHNHDDEYDDDEEEWISCSDDEDEDYETENEDESVSTDETETEDEDEDDEYDKKDEVVIKNKIKNKIVEKNLDNNPNILEILKGLHENNKTDDTISECIKVCENKLRVNKEKQEQKNTKQKDKNHRIFRHILRDKNTMNDFEFFEKMEIEEQKKIIKELKEINKITRIEKPYRLSILESQIPLIFKSAALKKINTLRNMEPGSGEFYKIKNWVDTFMRVPFGKYNELPVFIDDGVDKCHDFMANAQKTLDEAVYGLNDAKMQIMQMLGQLVTNPKSIGTAIAIHGPAGTGKTTLVKEGISKILNRPFAFIALGGATDSSFLEGHGYTYEGSTWGKIVQILIDSKCMNPVIYFDELDKISDTPKGEEITGILTHLTDTSQNSQFHDKYFSEIDFDLSKCLFIFSYNDESKVNPILKDRMYRIQTKGYNQKQKTIIAGNHLLPKIREQVRFQTEDIIISNEAIHYIIENHCNKEDGVRNLKRCLEIIYTKLNLYRLMRPGSNLFEEDMSLKVEFPFSVTKDIVDKLIKTSSNNTTLYSMYL